MRTYDGEKKRKKGLLGGGLGEGGILLYFGTLFKDYTHIIKLKCKD
jgi:hypothetical protein